MHEQPKKRNERPARLDSLVVASPSNLSTPVCLVAGRRGTDHTDDETNELVDLVVEVVEVVVADRRLMVSATPAGRFVSFRFVSFRRRKPGGVS